MSRRLKTAVIGLGAAGRFHCEAITGSVPEMQLAAVVESAAAVAERTAKQYGVPAFPTHRELLRAGVCEAVTIATPHNCHADIAVDCLRAGIHAITEKPMAESVGQADRMVRAARAGRAALGCVFQMRFDATVEKAAAIIRSGRLGKLFRATLVFCDFRTQTYYDSNVWRATWKGEGGGVLLNQAPHHIDVFAHLAGMPEAVLGRLSTRLHRIEVEDHAEAILRYKGGATGYILCTTNEPTHGNYLEISGDCGRLVLREGAIELYTYQQGLRQMVDKSPEMWGRPEVRPVKVAVKPRKVGHGLVFRNFARHVLFGEELRCDGVSALDSLELANAITLSHFTGKEVCLPINRNAYAALLRRLQAASTFKKKHVRVQRTTDPRMK
jgi:UDP-N-acetyl-2-amino-2-deoxyglucuronate dehydrogenase